tara:strand:- start:2401 stop:3621 length:1221 start_codon:yes stop_codon:yes gene_type:complete
MLPADSSMTRHHQASGIEADTLRNEPKTDISFSSFYEESALSMRITALWVGILLVAITPFYDRLLLQVPESFVAFSRWMQFGVQVPPLLLALFCSWHPSLRRWSAPVTLSAVMLTAMGLSAQHIVGKMHDFHVPHDFSVIALSACLLCSRIRVSYMLPWITMSVLVITSAQMYSADFSSAALYDAASLWMMFGFSVLAAQTIERATYENWRQRLMLESQAAHDGLTSLPNRRHFDRTMISLMRQASREGKNISLMIMDVDHFKLYNDRYGHPAGDECLRRIASCMRDAMRRPNDFCARVGGEEFAAVWFDARSDIAPALADQMRASVADLNIEHLSAVGTSVVTCSAGFAQVCAIGGEEAAEAAVSELYEQADRALYEAKRAGRNRMAHFGETAKKRSGAALWPMI